MIDTPQLIQFETSTACDASCNFCPVGVIKLKRPAGNMKQEVFEKIIHDGMEMGIKSYIPFLNGEPILFKKLFSWLDYMAARDLKVTLFTNASHLTKEKAERLSKYTNIEHLTVSFHGGTKEAYEKVMGLDFDNAKANVEYFKSISPFPVRVYMLRQKLTKGTEEAFQKLWGKDAFLSDAFFNWAGLINASEAGELVGLPKPCHRVLYHITILWDGRVALCCMDYHGAVILGDVTKEPLSDIWERNQPMRDRHHASDFDMPLCKSCNMNRY